MIYQWMAGEALLCGQLTPLMVLLPPMMVPQIREVLAHNVLPAASLLPANTALVFEVWAALRHLPYPQRFSLYADLREAAAGSPLLTASAKLAETEVKRILRRVTAPANKVSLCVCVGGCVWVCGWLGLVGGGSSSLGRHTTLASASHLQSESHFPHHPRPRPRQREAKQTSKPLGRMLAKIMAANPLAVSEQLTRQVMSLQGMVASIVESFKFLTPMAFDVMTFTLLKQLASAKKKLKVRRVVCGALGASPAASPAALGAPPVLAGLAGHRPQGHRPFRVCRERQGALASCCMFKPCSIYLPSPCIRPPPHPLRPPRPARRTA